MYRRLLLRRAADLQQLAADVGRCLHGRDHRRLRLLLGARELRHLVRVTFGVRVSLARVGVSLARIRVRVRV